MSRKSKYPPLLLANGLEFMLDKIPRQALTDAEKAQQALRKFRLRQDNQEPSAFSELLTDLMNCIQTERLTKKDVVDMLVQFKVHFEQ